MSSGIRRIPKNAVLNTNKSMTFWSPFIARTEDNAKFVVRDSNGRLRTKLTTTKDSKLPNKLDGVLLYYLVYYSVNVLKNNNLEFTSFAEIGKLLGLDTRSSRIEEGFDRLSEAFLRYKRWKLNDEVVSGQMPLLAFYETTTNIKTNKVTKIKIELGDSLTRHFNPKEFFTQIKLHTVRELSPLAQKWYEELLCFKNKKRLARDLVSISERFGLKTDTYLNARYLKRLFQYHCDAITELSHTTKLDFTATILNKDYSTIYILKIGGNV